MDDDIKGNHDFTVLIATMGYEYIVEVGDVQDWSTAPDGKTGTISVKGKEAFWKDKVFVLQSQNYYVAEGTDENGKYRIDARFRRGMHTTSNVPVWQIYATATVGELLHGGPPDWGGQNQN
ncbi:hypothetical protein [Chiayiivirga flava]|uniref:Uncharacterized protein n=1 Tax=Chiayiivirga flava TaxID=659595 RepID=A0A7W8D328_9GAMM|nr:hypothetical protein [Chiayiivirga flava]MBB5207043.1 hypothetical protein [Chiayiivirga flava]